MLVPQAAAVIADAGSHRPTPPGSLGDALHAAGKRTAVVGNADLVPNMAVPTMSGRDIIERPAAVALMDGEGRVDTGQVEAGVLLEETDEAPFGWRADADQVVAATNLALTGADVVLVDPGDLDRAATLPDIEAPPRFTVPARDRALRDTDALLGRLTADLPSDILVLVVSVIPPAAEWRLTPVVATGAGVVRGYLHSPSTKRLGLVTLTDVAPTVLAAVGADVPGAMIGRPLRYHPGEPDVARLAGLDDAAAFRQSIYYLTILGFIVFQALVYLAVAAVLRRPRHGSRPRMNSCGPPRCGWRCWPSPPFRWPRTSSGPCRSPPSGAGRRCRCSSPWPRPSHWPRRAPADAAPGGRWRPSPGSSASRWRCCSSTWPPAPGCSWPA